MQRLKTRPQFQAALAGGTVARTAHFALHRVAINAGGPLSAAAASIAPTKAQETSVPAGGAAQTAVVASSAVADSVALPTARSAPLPLFSVADVWLGAMVPKRWARRAVTRNAIKRQIYAVSAALESPLPQAAHVVRLRATFDRKQFVSASSCALKQAVRAELVQLFARAAAAARGAAA